MKTSQITIPVAAMRLINTRCCEVWGTCSMKNLGSWASGSGFPLEYQGMQGLPYLFCKVSDMNRPGNEVYIKTTANTVDDRALQLIRAKLHPPGTVIFPKIGGAIATNKRRILARHSAIDNNLLGISPHKSTYPDWLFQFLRSVDFEAYQVGTSVPALKQGTIGEVTAPCLSIDVQKAISQFMIWLDNKKVEELWGNAPHLPSPLDEQRRVVARVEQLAAKIQEARNIRQQAIGEVGPLFSGALSTLTANSGATPSRLDSICAQVTDGEHATPARIPERGVPLVTAKNVRDGYLDLKVTDFLTPETAEKCWQRCHPKHDDVLMVCVGATTGRVCRLQNPPPIVIVRSVALLRPNTDSIEPRFLEYSLESAECQRQIWASVKQAAQPCLYIHRIKNLTVPVPSLPEQRRIIAYLDNLQAKVGALRKLQAETAAELDALMPSILDKAFRGEL